MSKTMESKGPICASSSIWTQARAKQATITALFAKTKQQRGQRDKAENDAFEQALLVVSVWLFMWMLLIFAVQDGVEKKAKSDEQIRVPIKLERDEKRTTLPASAPGSCACAAEAGQQQLDGETDDQAPALIDARDAARCLSVSSAERKESIAEDAHEDHDMKQVYPDFGRLLQLARSETFNGKEMTALLDAFPDGQLGGLDEDGFSVLHHVCDTVETRDGTPLNDYNIAAIHLLFGHPTVLTTINLPDRQKGRTPLHWAIYLANWLVFGLLVQCVGLRFDIVDIYGKAAEDYAGPDFALVIRQLNKNPDAVINARSEYRAKKRLRRLSEKDSDSDSDTDAHESKAKRARREQQELEKDAAFLASDDEDLPMSQESNIDDGDGNADYVLPAAAAEYVANADAEPAIEPEDEEESDPGSPSSDSDDGFFDIKADDKKHKKKKKKSSKRKKKALADEAKADEAQLGDANDEPAHESASAQQSSFPDEGIAGDELLGEADEQPVDSSVATPADASQLRTDDTRSARDTSCVPGSSPSPSDPSLLNDSVNFQSMHVATILTSLRSKKLFAFTSRYPYTPIIFKKFGKRLENRFFSVGRGWLAAHMGKEQFTPWQLAAHGKQHLINAFKLPSFAEISGKGALWGLVYIEEVVANSTNEWAMPGCLHWLIRWVVPFPKPIPCVGSKDLWPVSEHHIALISQSLNLSVE